jgi:hypothetical protein
MSEKVKRCLGTRQRDNKIVDVATRLLSWQKGLFPTLTTNQVERLVKLLVKSLVHRTVGKVLPTLLIYHQPIWLLCGLYSTTTPRWEELPEPRYWAGGLSTEVTPFQMTGKPATRAQFARIEITSRAVFMPRENGRGSCDRSVARTPAT